MGEGQDEGIQQNKKLKAARWKLIKIGDKKRLTANSFICYLILADSAN